MSFRFCTACSLRTATLTMALLASACSVAPPAPPELPFTLPSTFAAEPSGAFASAEGWWTEFEDERLNRFVDTALRDSPGLAQAITSWARPSALSCHPFH